jgi:WXG100 family type VII secretion target
LSVSQTNAELMETTARRFEDVNASLDSTLRRLLSELEGLRSQWTGAGGRSFEQVKLAWAAEQEKLNRALAETATAVRTAGRQYTVTDTAAADRFTVRHSMPL